MRVALALLLLCVAPVAAQDSTAVVPSASPAGALDARLFRAVYAVDAPAVAGVLRAAEATSYPVIFGTAPVAWGVAALSDGPYDPALRLTASVVLAGGATFVLKHVAGRERPFAGLGVAPRRDVRRLDPRASFPSGHASMTFALATSASLSAGRWYVTVPAVGYATAVSVGRVWHGVHYPSDVAAGAVLGAGAALLVHALAPSVDGVPAGEAFVVPVVVRL